MSAPSKPWEGMNHNHQPVISNGYIDDLSYPQRPGGLQGQPPPLPPRRRVPSSNPYNSYGVGYGGAGFGGAYGSSYMSPFGNSLYGSSPYGMAFSPYRTSPFEPRMGVGAEDGLSPFQTVESVVRAISSLSMMMESTYQSMFMSFRAVMGVAENMERLRRVVLDLFGGIAIVKSVVWFFKKILYILGLIRNNPSGERLWEAAAAEVVTGASNGPPAPTRRTWPLVAFFGLMLGGPYVLYKLIQPPEDPQKWDFKKDGVKCVALYDFDTNQRGELPFRRGEVLVRQRAAQGGWALAVKMNRQTGYVPVDWLKPISAVQQKAVSKPRGSRPPQVYQPPADGGQFENPSGLPPPPAYHHDGGRYGNRPGPHNIRPNNLYVQVPTRLPVIDSASTSNDVVQPNEEVVQPNEEVVQPNEDVVQPNQDVVQPENNAMVPANSSEDPTDPVDES